MKIKRLLDWHQMLKRITPGDRIVVNIPSGGLVGLQDRQTKGGTPCTGSSG